MQLVIILQLYNIAKLHNVCDVKHHYVKGTEHCTNPVFFVHTVSILQLQVSVITTKQISNSINLSNF